MGTHNPFLSRVGWCKYLTTTFSLSAIAAILLLGDVVPEEPKVTIDPEKSVLEREKLFLHRLEESPDVFRGRQLEYKVSPGNRSRLQRGRRRKRARSEPTMDESTTILIYVNRYQEISSSFVKNLLSTYRQDIRGCVLPEGFTCRLSTNEGVASQADAVIHVPSARWLEDPLEYKQGQLHVLFQPVPLKTDYKDSYLITSFFDMTMTYKTTSSIPILTICRHNTIKILEELSLTTNSASQSPKGDEKREKNIASFLSGCKRSGNSHFSDDVIFLSQLMDQVKIDSYGTCFHNKDTPYPLCGKECNSLIANRYKIVLAFDSPLDGDQEFISDAIYTAYRSGAIPVYFGSDAIFELVPGAHTFIHADQYHTSKELGIFLEQILQSEELLAGYKDNWNVERLRVINKAYCFNGTSPICRLCHKVYETRQQQLL